MKLQNLSKRLLQILTSYNIIHKTMLHKKLRSLKSLRKLLTDRLLDHARSGKTDQRSWFCQDNISQHCKACRHTTGRRFCQDRYIQKSGFTVTLQCCRSLCHLHQRCDPLLHSGTSRTGKDNNRELFLSSTLHRSGNLFTDSPAHTRHQKSSVADRDHGISAAYLAFSCDYSFSESGFLLKCLHLFRITFVINRISTDQIVIPLFKRSLINYHLDSAVCMHTEISSALRTDIVSFFYILCDNSSSTFVAFTQKPFRYLRSGGTGRIMALYSGNNPCLFEHVIQLHDH